MMKRRFPFLSAAAAIVLGCTGSPASAQDIHFSHFYENSILRNPALTGIFSGDYKACVNYRNQWGSISVPFQTVLASAESRVLVNKEAGDYLSYGLALSYDRAGSIDFNSMQAYGALNYNKSMENEHGTYISVGFAGGYIQRAVDMQKMTLDEQYVNGGYSPTNANGELLSFSKMQHFDGSVGVSLNSSAGEDNRVNYYFGAAAYHVSRPKESFDPNQTFIRLTTRWTANLGIQYRINSEFNVTMHANYQAQKPYHETLIGGFVGYKPANPVMRAQQLGASIGLFGRLNDALIPTFKLDYQKYSFIMSYDVNTSSLTRASSGQGGWEFSVIARGVFKREVTASVQCPRFEEEMQSF